MKQVTLGKSGIMVPQNGFGALPIQRAPSQGWLSEYWQAEMAKIEKCVECSACLPKCPYGLNIPELLKKNLEDYKEVLAGNRQV